MIFFYILIGIVLAISIFNFIILLGISSFLLKLADSLHGEPLAMTFEEVDNDSGLVDIEAPPGTYDLRFSDEPIEA